MVWAALWSSVAGCAVLAVVTTAAEMQSAGSDDAYFRSSARLWVFVGVVVAAMSCALAPSLMPAPLVAGGGSGAAQGIFQGFMVAPAAVATLVCWHNAWALQRVRQRRRAAREHGRLFEATVVDREEKFLGHDLFEVTLEVLVPSPRRAVPHQGGYRTAAADAQSLAIVRLVETCTGDRWGRLAPGTTVQVRVDTNNPRCFGLV